ncbi:hypothetical protein AN220_00240 [Streptomyces nanshensis]|nr:hypothetical protein AN220_00240 [Streptomyces nanshensis]
MKSSRPVGRWSTGSGPGRSPSRGHSGCSWPRGWWSPGPASAPSAPPPGARTARCSSGVTPPGRRWR